jgi:hypothetical protein
MFVLTAGGLLASGQFRLVALGRGTRDECEAMQERFARLGLLRLNKAYGPSEGGGDAAINPQLTSYGNGLDSVARLIAEIEERRKADDIAEHCVSARSASRTSAIAPKP